MIFVQEKPIKKTRLSQAAVEMLTYQIHTGILRPGERLPPERVLSSSLGVSRTVIREALEILHSQDLIEVIGGERFIRSHSFDEIIALIPKTFTPDDSFILEMMELRIVLDCYMAKKAAGNPNPEMIEKMQTSIDTMHTLLEKGSVSFASDIAFHHYMAEASGNSALVSIYNLCADMVSSTNEASLSAAFHAGMPITAVAEHQAILDAIKTGDIDKAEAAMYTHSSVAYANLKAQNEKDNASPDSDAGECRPQGVTPL